MIWSKSPVIYSVSDSGLLFASITYIQIYASKVVTDSFRRRTRITSFILVQYVFRAPFELHNKVVSILLISDHQSMSVKKDLVIVHSRL